LSASITLARYRFWLRLSALLSCLSFSGLGLAADPAPGAAGAQPADAKREESRMHFEKAIALFEEESWDAALVEFLRSREVYATRAATKDAALCLRKLHRFDEALDLFQALLKEFPTLPAEDRSLAEHSIKELAALVGNIDIRAAESGATLVVDGRERGTVPSPLVRVNAGTHLIRVSREGFLPFETQVQVAGAQTVIVQAKLAPLTRGGRLKVGEQAGKSADVIVDNVQVGKTPWEGALPAGNHMVVLRAPEGLGTQPVAAPVRLNEVTALTLTLEPLSAKLRIEPTPAGANVALDGIAVGRGVWEGPVRVGRHRVEVGSEGFLPVTRELQLTRDKREVVAVSLDRDPNSAAFRAQNPPHVVFEATGAFLASPTLGGSLTNGCTAPCSKAWATGALAVLHGGYQLSSGLSFWLDGGFMSVAEPVKQRSVTLTPRGLSQFDGVANDSLRLSGALLGASAGLSRGQTLRLRVRLSAGAFVGSATDQRKGSAVTSERPGFPSTNVDFDVTESPSAKYLFVAPELRAGLRLSQHWELSAGIGAWILLGFSDVVWLNSNPPTYPDSVGEVEFNAKQSMVGRTIVLLAPELALKWDL
jgi:hypothetical protein